MPKKARKAPAAHVRRLQREMQHLTKRVDALVVTARKAERNMRTASLRQLAMLHRKQAQAKKALARLGRQSAAASGPIKSGLQKAWRDIDLAVRQASRRFRQAA